MASTKLPWRLDPFMGSGTTDVGVLKLNRKFIGIEIDEKRLDDAARRLSEFAS